MTTRVLAVVLLAVCSVPLPAAAQRGDRPDVLVAATASLSGMAAALTRGFHEEHGIHVRFNFAASNTLARQIVEGAPADVFISADAAQMDLLQRAGRLVDGTRVELLANQLVVIAGADAPAPRRVGDLAAADVRRVAMGDPAGVPAGVYGRQWLEGARLWAAVERKLVRLTSSPAALAAVREGRADAGIVYATDAAQSRGIRIVHVVPADEGPRIVYPAAAVAGGRDAAARAFLQFLRGPRARAIFEEAGFRVLPVG